MSFLPVFILYILVRFLSASGMSFSECHFLYISGNTGEGSSSVSAAGCHAAVWRHRADTERCGGAAWTLFLPAGIRYTGRNDCYVVCDYFDTVHSPFLDIPVDKETDVHERQRRLRKEIPVKENRNVRQYRTGMAVNLIPCSGIIILPLILSFVEKKNQASQENNT